MHLNLDVAMEAAFLWKSVVMELLIAI